MCRLLLLAVPLMLVTACAAPPPAPVAGTPAPTAVAPDSGATSPAAKSTPAALRDAARHAGYQPRTVNGEVLYCHEETPIGTRFPSSVCLTEAQLAARLQGSDDVKEMMRHPGSTDPAK